MIANETEGAMIVQQMAAQPAQRRLPLIAHWGLSAGDFPAVAGEALRAVDLVVVQTFSFRDAKSAKAKAVKRGAVRVVMSGSWGSVCVVDE
jgi:branched-chain amino acid transport system substrate-binding protein